jgi:hypothetical protein
LAGIVRLDVLRSLLSSRMMTKKSLSDHEDFPI